MRGPGKQVFIAVLEPVEGRAGLIHLHKAIVLVSRVVGRQDIHFIPVLRLSPETTCQGSFGLFIRGFKT